MDVRANRFLLYTLLNLQCYLYRDVHVHRMPIASILLRSIALFLLENYRLCLRRHMQINLTFF